MMPGKRNGSSQPAVSRASTRRAAGQHLKMLRQSLKGMPGALDALKSLDIDSERRAETLGVDDFVAIARLLS